MIGLEEEVNIIDLVYFGEKLEGYDDGEWC